MLHGSDRSGVAHLESRAPGGISGIKINKREAVGRIAI